MPNTYWPAIDSPGGCGSIIMATSAAKPNNKPALFTRLARGLASLSAVAETAIGNAAVSEATCWASDILRLPQARQRNCGLALQAAFSQLLDAIGRVTGA